MIRGSDQGVINAKKMTDPKYLWFIELFTVRGYCQCKLSAQIELFHRRADTSCSIIHVDPGSN